MQRKKLSFNLLGPYVARFINNMKLLPISNKAYLGVSAGPDSIFLLKVLREYLPDITLIALHVNYKTREESDIEESFLKEFCRLNKIEFISKTCKLNLLDSNFEKEARVKRYSFFKENLEEGDCLYLGHHIDDSFEWHLMQKFKSSKYPGSLGIPIVNGQIFRPLMCLTKDQIVRTLNDEGIDFHYDKSNDDINYERNFIRHEVVAAIKTRYPSYLKNYVYKANLEAKAFGIHRLIESNVNLVIKENLKIGTISLRNEDNSLGFTTHKEKIRSLIEKLSSSSRGSIRDQLDKLLQAVKSSKKGPLIFSGGVYAYILHDSIYLLNSTGQRYWENQDIKISSQIPGSCVLEGPINEFFPLVMAKNASDRFFKKDLPSLRSIHPLLPKFTWACIQGDIWFNSRTKFLKLCKGRKHIMDKTLFIS